jgi:NAD(P)-dependent dehydrogenase (short-subunit alcohol dehydrogenase family)
MVTGAAAGIGQAIAQRLAEAGADLHLVDRNARGLELTMEAMNLESARIRLHQVDLSTKQAIDELWEGVKGSEPDVLVNNAGIFPFKDYLETDEKFLNQVLEINLKSVFWMCQHMVSGRGARGGSIVNIGTIEAILPFKSDLASYAVSKSGVIALTRTLAREYGRKGFRANAVLPGGVLTPGTQEAAMEILRGNLELVGDLFRYRQRLPTPRMALPDDVARMVLVLASDLAGFVNGAIIPVDGGFLSA